jgi:hypothetical protein
MAELGVVAAQGTVGLKELLAIHSRLANYPSPPASHIPHRPWPLRHTDLVNPKRRIDCINH